MPNITTNHAITYINSILQVLFLYTNKNKLPDPDTNIGSVLVFKNTYRIY